MKIEIVNSNKLIDWFRIEEIAKPTFKQFLMCYNEIFIV